MSGDASPVPTKQGVWCDEPASSERPGECLGDGAEQRPVVIVERWSGVQSVQDAELVTQDDDLKVFGAAGTYSEAGKRREEAVQNSIHTLRIGGDLPCSTATSEFRAPTGNSTAQHALR